MEPEGDVSIEESSDDSYVSADEEEHTETSEDESEQVENMDE